MSGHFFLRTWKLNVRKYGKLTIKKCKLLPQQGIILYPVDCWEFRSLGNTSQCHVLRCEWKVVWPLWKTLSFCVKLNVLTPYKPVLLLGVLLRKLTHCISGNVQSAHSTIGGNMKNWKLPKHALQGNGVTDCDIFTNRILRSSKKKWSMMYELKT